MLEMNIPARKLKMSAVKNIVRFPAIKANGGKTILVESILESKYCLHLEFDSTVETYFPQPKTFAIPSESEKNRYTPDFEVHYMCGQRKYVEVKPLHRASSEHYQLLLSRFELSIEKTLTKFLLVNEAEILKQPLLSNYEKLYQYRKRPTINMRSLHQFAEIHHVSMPLSRLISELGNQISLREIYTWLALGYLRFDINSEELGMMTEVKFDVC